MGFRFRKIINLGGGFRINVSQSGIGYSWGVPGYRITRTASGKTRRTASIPGTGISYVTENSDKSNVKTKASQQKNFLVTDIENVDSGNTANLQPAEFIDLIAKIQRTITINIISTCILSGSIILGIFYPNAWFGILFLASLAFKIAIHTTGYIRLDYSFDDNSNQCADAKKRIESWEILKKCKQIWYIDKVGKTTSSRNSGGATHSYNRIPTRINFKLPYYLRSNINLPIIRMEKSKETLIILPDCLLLIKHDKVGAVRYEDLNVDIYAIGEICNEPPASDCKFSKNVWLYANKNGTPDMRHKDNRQLPMYEIGRIDFSSPNGLDVRLAISNTNLLEKFQENFSNLSNN